MTNVFQTKPLVAASPLKAAAVGAILTVLALYGGLMGGLIGGSFTFHGLIGNAPDPLTYTLSAIIFGTGILGGSALWGVGMAHLARSLALRRAAWASILGFVPIAVVVNFALLPVESLVLQSDLPVHWVFSALFVPTAFLIAGTSSLALGWALGWGRAARTLALHVGLAAALTFLASNLSMDLLGWRIGGPGAEERGTMITVLLVSNLGAALAGGALLGMKLTRPRWSHSQLE